MLKFILSVCLLFISCDLRPSTEKKAEVEANNFYNQVCQMVYATSGSSFSPGWQQIKKNYKSGKRILFLSANSDFSIVVVRNFNNEVVKYDSMKIQEEPIDTVQVAETATTILDRSLKNIQGIANKFQENKFGK
jgi:hypothetical protein